MEGFKQTEIGWIPEDWEVKTVREVFNYLRTASYSRAQLNEIEGIGYIHYGDIHTKYNNYILIHQSTLPYISKDLGKSFPLLRNGDIVMADASEDYEGVGKAIEIKDLYNEKIIAGLHTLALRDNFSIFYNGYKGFVFSSPLVKPILEKLATGLKVYSISKSILNEILLPIPPLPEQEAIAKALSDVDSLIDTLERKIAKKRNIKQGAMQRLLTGKQRLPGFSGDWVEKKLSCLSQIMDGTHQTPKYVDIGIPFYSVENVTNNNFSNTKYISIAEHLLLTKKYKIEYGDVLMTRIGSIGDCKYIDWNTDASFYVSLALLKMNNNILAKYFVHYSRTEMFKNDIELHSLQFATPKKINLGNIGLVTIRYPESIAEQSAIAQILTDMDNEITTLEQKLNKYKQIKQGMMQELLTGKIRLL